MSIETSKHDIDTRLLRQCLDISVCLETFDGFARLAEREEPSPPGYLMKYESMKMKEWVDQVNASGSTISEIGAAFVRDALVYGCGHTLVKDQLVVDDIGLADVSREWHLQTRESLPHRAELIIDEPCIAFVGPGHKVYGHWLMDFLPRLYVAKQLLGDAFTTFSLLLPSDTPAFAIQLCLYLIGPDLRFRYYDVNNQRVAVKRLCIPSYPFSRTHDYNSVAKNFFNGMRPRVTGARKICISRKRMEHQSTGTAKSFPERDVFEALAILHGYEMVYPEQLQLHDQINLFASARVVVGEFGSALHNSIFCGPKTVVGATGFFSDAQLRLSSILDHVNVYVPQEWEEYREGVLHYGCNTISLAELFRAIDSHLEALADKT